MLYSPRLWPLVRAAWRGVLGVAALMVAGTVCGVTVAVLAGSALATAVDGEFRPDAVVWGGVLLVVRALLLVAQEVVAGRLTTRVTRDLRRRLVDHVLAVGPDVRTGRQAGSLSATMVEGVAATAGYVAVYAPTMVATLLGTLLVGGLLLALAPWSAALLLVGILAVPVLQRLWKRATAERGAAYWQATGAYAARLEDTLHGLETLAALGTADRRVAVLRADADEIARTATAGLRSAMFVYVLSTGSLGVATAGATVALAADAGAVGATAALVAWLLLPEGARPWQALQNAWHHGFSGITASGPLFEVLDRAVPVSDSGGDGIIGAAPEVRLEEVVAVRGGRRVLDGVTCRVAGGRTTALVGRSGSGKSTALGLLMRHRDADTGRVLVDGVDVRDLPLTVVRGAVGWVAQDVTLFHGTVEDNLRLAAPAASDLEIEEAARRARLLLPPTEGGLAHGLDTQVGERGTALSGGQRQRVAIARALLRDVPILVLDEATSALDAVNERAVARALAEAARGRTVIAVAHDRSGLPPVDDVLVLSEGRITTGAPDSDPVLT